jgi:hypothetical protein
MRRLTKWGLMDTNNEKRAIQTGSFLNRRMRQLKCNRSPVGSVTLPRLFVSELCRPERDGYNVCR